MSSYKFYVRMTSQVFDPDAQQIIPKFSNIFIYSFQNANFLARNTAKSENTVSRELKVVRDISLSKKI